MVEVRGLTKSYGDRLAINNLNFSVQKGEVVGFLGPNGAGKSTTMKILTGYMAPTSGSVKIGGYDVFENPIEVKRKIGYLPELPPVYSDMYVEDYLKFVARLHGVPSKNIKEQAQKALERTNLVEVRNRLIQNLSKGFKQRVGLAQALVSDPEILILDEPTVGLDPVQVLEVRRLIQALRGHHTIILSTHILPEVQATCSRIIIINRGEIVAEDSLDGLSKKMGGTIKVRMKVRRAHDQVVQSAARVNGVVSCLRDGVYLVAEVQANEETVEALASHIVKEGAGLLEIRSESSNLEDIFIRLTSVSNPHEEMKGG